MKESGNLGQRRGVSTALGLLISLVCLVILFSFTDFSKMLAAFQRAGLPVILLVAALSLAWLLARALAWRTLLQEKAGFSQVFFAINEGYLLNNLLPFRLGEVGRAFLLGRKADAAGNRLGFWTVFSTILIERALDMVFAVGILAASLPFVFASRRLALGTAGAPGTAQGFPAAAATAAIISGGVVLAGLSGLYLLAHYQAWVITQLEKFKALRRVRAGVFSSFLSGLAVLTSPQRLLRTLAWFVLNWGIGVSMYFLPLRVFFPEARFSWALFALGVAGLGVAAPSSPGSIGVLEGSIVAALAVFNLDSSTALAFAFMLHMVQYALTCLLGAYGLAREGETLTGLYRQLLKQKPVEINSNTDHHAKE